jgi:AcrR family transcriptional regulator
MAQAGRRSEATATARVATALDGRLRRSERSRQAIVGALFERIGEGVLQPTAQQVAERAGVGIRTVFRHFSEMDSLYAAMNARLEGDVRPALAGPRSGSLDERIAGLVRQRTQLFERIAPYKRAANLQRWRSRFLQDRHRLLQRALHDDVRAWLPEIGGLPEDAAEAVDLVTSFEAWDRLRADRELSVQGAAAVMGRALRALLPAGTSGRSRR